MYNPFESHPYKRIGARNTKGATLLQSEDYIRNSATGQIIRKQSKRDKSISARQARIEKKAIRRYEKELDKVEA